jgi:hypothetical protein
VRNITLSADEAAIEKARRRARLEGSTLNEQFRVWLTQFGNQPSRAERFDALMEKLSYVEAGRKFTRDEMNER